MTIRIERVARALYEALAAPSEPDWGRLDEGIKSAARKCARAVIEAMRYKEEIDDAVFIAAAAMERISAVALVCAYESVIDDALKEGMTGPLDIPRAACGIRLCKITRGGQLKLAEPVIFLKGAPAVETVLRRAEVSGKVGPIGGTGNFWADLLDGEGDTVETVALDRRAWNSLKNRWARCKMEPDHDRVLGAALKDG